MAPNPTKTFAGIYEAYLVEPSRKITKAWYDAWTQLVSNSNSSLVSGVNGSIQYNDNGVQAGDANLTWDKVTRQQEITGASASALRTTTSGAGNVTLHPASPLYNDVTLGMTVDATGNYIPDGTLAGYLFQSTASDEVGLEVQDGLTPGSPLSFATGQGVAVTGATATAPHAVEAYQYGGLGTGAVPGMILFADRNDSGSGAAGMLGGQLKDGRFFVIWMDATGAMRYNVGATLSAIRPTESGSVSDTSGFLFGSGSGSTTNITQLFTRRGEEGRSGIPGLPGAPGATGSTGATGPAGANGVIISRRADDGRMGPPGVSPPTGSAITALTGDVTATGPGSVAATIANSAVTLAKIANASANSKLVGSGASGSGAAYSELTLGTNLTMSGTTLNAAGGGGGALTLLSSQAASSSANIEFTNFSSTYDNYLLLIEAMLPQTNNTNFLMTFSDAGGYFATNYQWVQIFTSVTAALGPTRTGQTSDTSVDCFGGASNANALSAQLTITGVNQTSGFVMVMMTIGGFNSSAQFFKTDTIGAHALTQAMTKIKFAMSSGNIVSGTFKLYGYQN